MLSLKSLVAGCWGAAFFVMPAFGQSLPAGQPYVSQAQGGSAASNITLVGRQVRVIPGSSSRTSAAASAPEASSELSSDSAVAGRLRSSQLPGAG